MITKRFYIIISVCLIASILISLIVLFYVGPSLQKVSSNSNSNPSQNTNINLASNSNTPSENPPSSNNPVPTSNTPPNSGPAPVDSYVLPDFNRLKTLLASQQLIKDVPKSGSINLKFYHFFQGNRIWDKKYLLSAGTIVEKDSAADIDIWISSDYVSKITDNNLCDVIKEARNNGDLGQWTNIGDTKLLWTYSGMLKYKSCLGL